jgi:hypothetical protein
MRKDEVANGIGALDRVRVAVERLEEPGILVRDELACAAVCPELVLVVRVQVYAALLAFAPHVRDGGIFEGLVDDLGDQGGPVAGGVWARQFGAGDGVVGAGDEEKGEESPDGVNAESYEDEEPEEKDYGTSAHRVGCSATRRWEMGGLRCFVGRSRAKGYEEVRGNRRVDDDMRT